MGFKKSQSSSSGSVRSGGNVSSSSSKRVYTNSSVIFRKDNEEDVDYYDIDEIKQAEDEKNQKFLFDQSLIGLVDFDGDGDVDADDVSLLKGKMENGEINNDDPNLTTFKADLNGDGIVDDLDVLILDNYVKGNDVSGFVDSNYLQEKSELVGSDFAKNNDLKAFYKKNAGAHENELESYVDLLVNSLGDTNGDHKLTSSDIDALREYMNRPDCNHDTLNYRDLNGDGVFDNTDLQIMSDFVEGKDVFKNIDQVKLLDYAYDKNIKDYKQQISYYESYKEYLETHGETTAVAGAMGTSATTYVLSDETKAKIAEIDAKIAELNGQIRNAEFARNDISEYVTFNRLNISDYNSDKSNYWQKNVDYEKVYQAYLDGKLGDVTSFLTEDAIKNGDYSVDYLAIIEYLAKEKLVDYTTLKGMLPDSCLFYDKLNEEQIKKFHEIFKEKGSDAAISYAYSLADEVGLYDDSTPPDLAYENARFLSDDQKKYFQYLYDTQGKEVAESYLSNASIYTNFVSKINENGATSVGDKTNNDYFSDFVNEKYDLDGNGIFDIADVSLLQNKLKNKDTSSDIPDLTGDGVFDDTDLKLLQRHLNGEIVDASACSIEFVTYTYESKLEDYTTKRDNLMEYSNELKNIYDTLPDSDPNANNPNKAIMTKADADRLLDDLSTQIALMNQLIVSQKNANKLLPYVNKSCSDEFRDYVKNYHPDWQAEVDYEKLYDIYINNSHQLPNTSGLAIKDELLENARLNDPEEYQRLLNYQVDWIAVADYFINVKGENMEDLPDTLWTGIDYSYSRYKYMTDDQQYMYHYLFETEGYEAANYYIEHVIDDELRQKEAKENITEYIETLNPHYEYDEEGNIISVSFDDNAMNTIRQFIKGFDKGMTDYYSGMLKWGEDGYTLDEYEQMYMMKFLSDNDLLIDAFNAGETVGYVETAASITTFITLVCPEGVGGYTSLAFNNAISTLNAGGNAQHGALLEGYDEDTANEYAREIMKNTLITNMASSTIGLGVASTFQYVSLFDGVNNIGIYNNIMLSLANGAVGLEAAMYQAERQDDISEAILNKRFTVDERNAHKTEAFFNAMLASAVSTAKTVSFELILDGEAFSFSSDDWLDYLKSTDNPTAEDFINSYSGSYTIDPETGKTVHIYYENGKKQAVYIDGPDEVGNHILGIIDKNKGTTMSSNASENLKFLINNADNDTIKYIINNLSDGDVDGTQLVLSNMTSEQFETFINSSESLKVAKTLSGWIDITEPKALVWTFDKKTGKFSVDEDWPPHGGNDLSKGIETLDKYSGKIINGEEIVYIDRVGGTGGGTYAVMPEDGSINTMGERGIFNNPETDNYRQISFSKTKYIKYCDTADEIVSYCDANGISYSLAATDEFVASKIASLADELGVDFDTARDSIFAGRGSYTADYAKKDDGSFWRPEIGDLKEGTGKSDKYGYVGTAAPWTTKTGEVIAPGGATQFNLRASEATLAKLGIIKYTYNGKARGFVRS